MQGKHKKLRKRLKILSIKLFKSIYQTFLHSNSCKMISESSQTLFCRNAYPHENNFFTDSVAQPVGPAK